MKNFFTSSRFTYFFVVFQVVLSVYLLSELKTLKKGLFGFQKKAFPLLQRHEILTQELLISFEQALKIRDLPQELQEVPFADEQGVVLSQRTLEIPGVVAPYNGSLVDIGGRYSLFFRYDLPLSRANMRKNKSWVPFHSHIGCVELNSQFAPIHPYVTIDTGSSFSEDPRVISMEGHPLIVYNDRILETERYRGIRLAHLDSHTYGRNYVTAFDRRNFVREKNWTPFSPNGKDLYFVYTINPHEILKLVSPQTNELCPATMPEERSHLSDNDWPKKWGTLRGGTPPQLVEGQYLSFFHSSFADPRGIVWYVMGAYTFEPVAPYRITKISPYPILFKGIYDTPHQNTANCAVRAIYPAGFILQHQEGRDLIHLSCGENDSAVKIITLDQKALLHSLHPVESSPR